MTDKPAGLEAFDEVERLIVIGAHPDDLECSSGGTLALLIDRGVEVYSVNCTLGDLGTRESGMTRSRLATIRQEETEAAARLMGLKGTFNLGHHDGELVNTLELRAEIARLYRITQADTLFTFDPYWAGQMHPDHRAAGQAALDAYMPAKMPLYRPEQLQLPGADLRRLHRIFLFSTDRDPEIYVDVTEVYDRKLAACMAHRCQFPKGEESLEWMRGRNAKVGEVIGVKHAEAFKRAFVW